MSENTSPEAKNQLSAPRNIEPSLKHSKMKPISSSTESTKVIMPDFLAPDVKSVDFRLLRNQFNIRFALLDVDNTLTSVAGKKIDPGTVQYLQELQRDGTLDGIYLATRSGRDLSSIEAELNVKVFRSKSGTKKPDTEYFKEITAAIGCKPNEIVMIGDRLIHDIQGAKAAGLITVLVNPIAKGWIKGWIPTDFLGTYWRERKAQGELKYLT